MHHHNDTAGRKTNDT